MAKALGIDFGTKRTGIAITDAMQIIAGGLTTVLTHLLDDFIDDLVNKESIECFVVGDPKNLDGTNTDSSGHVNGFIKRLQKKYPQIPVHQIDERFTKPFTCPVLLVLLPSRFLGSPTTKHSILSF